MKKKVLRTSGLLALTAVFIFFFVRSVNWNQVLSHIVGINLLFFLLIIPFSPLHFFTRAFRWKFLLKPEKKDVAYLNMVKANIVGFTVTFLFPGRLGEVVKPIYLARKENMRQGYVIGTVVVERIFDMFTNCLFLGLFLLARPLYAGFYSLEPDSLRSLTFWGLVGVGIASGILLLTLAMYFFREKAVGGVSFLVKRFPAAWREKTILFVREFIDGLKFFHSMGSFFLYMLLSFVVWLGVIFFYWLFFMAYGVKLPFFLMVPYIFLTMVGASLPTPGMIGGFDYFSRLGMTSLYGLEASMAVGMTLVVHTLQVVVTCVLGYAILAREGLSLGEVKKMGEARKT